MRPLAIGAVLTALLVLPTGVQAQSAGDDQYSDPLAPSEQPADRGGSIQGSTPQPPEPAPTEGAPVAPAQTSEGAPATDDAGALPRTGLSVVLLFATAFPLLLGGFALRRTLREA